MPQSLPVELLMFIVELIKYQNSDMYSLQLFIVQFKNRDRALLK
jgi:hypothetical protein